MQQVSISRENLVSRKKQDILSQHLMEIIRQASQLLQRITHQISTATHSETVDEIGLYRECDLCMKEYVYLTNIAVKTVTTVEKRIADYYEQKRFVKTRDFPAHSWSPVVMLHILREQSMGRRHQELQDFEKKKQDMIKKLEEEIAMIKQGFFQIVPQLNLLCYMKECLQEEHVLPPTIMYQEHIKQTIQSPFPAPAAPQQPHVHYTRKKLNKPRLEEQQKLLKKLRNLHNEEQKEQWYQHE